MCVQSLLQGRKDSPTGTRVTGYDEKYIWDGWVVAPDGWSAIRRTQGSHAWPHFNATRLYPDELSRTGTSEVTA